MAGKILSSWKEIAAYVGRSVRTVQRWEQSLAFPIHRPEADRNVLFARTDEIDDWVMKTPENALQGSEVEGEGSFRYRILVVDDEPAIRQTSKMLLESHGYEVQVAEGGFAALVRLERSLPDIIISDLRMPNMSGFEFLSIVRRRFPHIGVIAVSGEFFPAVGHDDALLADAFVQKGNGSPEQVLQDILRLLEAAPIRPRVRPTEKAAVWIPRSGSEYVVVTCPYCLRTFSTSQPTGDRVTKVPCQHCPQSVTFRIAV